MEISQMKNKYQPCCEVGYNLITIKGTEVDSTSIASMAPWLELIYSFNTSGPLALANI